MRFSGGTLKHLQSVVLGESMGQTGVLKEGLFGLSPRQKAPLVEKTRVFLMWR